MNRYSGDSGEHEPILALWETCCFAVSTTPDSLTCVIQYLMIHNRFVSPEFQIFQERLEVGEGIELDNHARRTEGDASQRSSGRASVWASTNVSSSLEDGRAPARCRNAPLPGMPTPFKQYS